jgi:hypothetical protein
MLFQALSMDKKVAQSTDKKIFPSMLTINGYEAHGDE